MSKKREPVFLVVSLHSACTASQTLQGNKLLPRSSRGDVAVVGGVKISDSKKEIIFLCPEKQRESCAAQVGNCGFGMRAHVPAQPPCWLVAFCSTAELSAPVCAPHRAG